MLRTVVELIRISFKRQLTFRIANWAGLATNLFFGILRVSVLVALFAQKGNADINGMSIQQAIAFAGITQSVISYLSLFGWYDLMQSVYTGQIATDLIKPVPFFIYWLGIDLGRAAASLLVRAITLMTLFSLIYHIALPDTWHQWLALLISMLLGELISFSWRYLINLASFWTPNAIGIGRLAFSLPLIFAGFYIPLRLLPDWFNQLCHFTPFPSMVNTTVEIFIGSLNGQAMVNAIAMQLLWFIVLALLGNLVLNAGIKKMVVQGG